MDRNEHLETIGLIMALSFFFIAHTAHAQVRGRTTLPAQGALVLPANALNAAPVMDLNLNLDLNLDLAPAALGLPLGDLPTPELSKPAAARLAEYGKTMGRITEGMADKKGADASFGSGRALENLMTGQRDAAVSAFAAPVLAANRMSAEEKLEKQVDEASAFVEAYRAEYGKAVVGQEELRDSLLLALLSGGHVLLEGLPGVAKTRSAMTLAGMTDLQFNRIQFTRDLQPFDIMGQMERQGDHWAVRKGPVFANLVLADEINRAKGQTQSAMLQAMEEGEVTIEGKTEKLPQPFMVLATQNPIEDEGVYPLPRAQLDRFMLKVDVPYADTAGIAQIIRMVASEEAISVERMLSREKLLETKKLVRKIQISDEVVDYIARLVAATRPGEKASPQEVKDSVRAGVSDRTAVLLARVAQAQAFIEGRHYVIPEDVKAVAHRVLAHRIILTFEAETRMSAKAIVDVLLDSKRGVPVTKS